MLVLDICENVDVLKVINIVVIILKIIQIVVPIVLMFSLMFKMIGAMTKHDDDAIASLKKKAVPNIVAAVLIFIVPLLVGIIMNVTLPDSEYTKCIVGISSEKLQQAYEEKAERLVSKAEETLNINDYVNAKNYMPNVKDKDKRRGYEERLEAVKALIDENRKTSPYGESTGLGSDIVASAELQEACRWILNQEEVKIRLQTCTNEHMYSNPEEELPGGSTELSAGNAKAKDTISLAEYQKGVFFGEEKIEIAPDSRYAYMIIYKTVLVHNTVHYAIRANRDPLNGEEITYTAGSCAQNYRNSLRVKLYDSGKYKEEIDDAVENTKYLVLANSSTGDTTDAHYHSYTGIEQAIEKAGREGKDYIDILENVITSDNDDSKYYQNARVYDCRNLVEDDDSEVDITNIRSNIIYTGDSRIQMFGYIKDKLGFNDEKEFIYARYNTKYDDFFENHMQQAESKVRNNKDKTFAVTANYGVNALGMYNAFCNRYEKTVNRIGNNNQFYIVSVNPVDDNKSKWARNNDIETFNNYMKNTCISRIKNDVPGSQVFYCDVYGSLTIDEWINKKYIMDDGVHYTDDGNKYIYDSIKKCIAKHEK